MWHVNIIILHVDTNKSHVNLIMLHVNIHVNDILRVDISKPRVNIIYLACRGEGGKSTIQCMPLCVFMKASLRTFFFNRYYRLWMVFSLQFWTNFRVLITTDIQNVIPGKLYRWNFNGVLMKLSLIFLPVKLSISVILDHNSE